MSWHRWQPAEDAVVRARFDAGVSWAVIGRELGVSYWQAQHRATRLGLSATKTVAGCSHGPKRCEACRVRAWRAHPRSAATRLARTNRQRAEALARAAARPKCILCGEVLKHTTRRRKSDTVCWRFHSRTLTKACIDCGVPFQTNNAGVARCEVDRAKRKYRGGRSVAYSRAAGWSSLRRELIGRWTAEYGWVCPGWQREEHPDLELTLDHVTPVAWQKAMTGFENGPFRGPYQVLCRLCNTLRGRDLHRLTPRFLAGESIELSYHPIPHTSLDGGDMRPLRQLLERIDAAAA